MQVTDPYTRGEGKRGTVRNACRGAPAFDTLREKRHLNDIPLRVSRIGRKKSSSPLRKKKEKIPPQAALAKGKIPA